MIEGEPTTCREMVERLRSRGLEVEWIGRKQGGIYICFKEEWSESLEDVLDVFSRKNVVMLIQLKTAKEALEKAGQMKGAFSWGRFLFWGDAELLARIEAVL